MASHSNLRTDSISGARDLDMMLSPLECQVPGMPRPHITIMRPEAAGRMRDYALVMHSARREPHPGIHGFPRRRRTSKWGRGIPQGTPHQQDNDNNKTYGAIPIRNAQHLTYLYLFNPALNKYMLYNKMISESQGLH